MAWRSVTINLILHSRKDLFSEVNVVEVMPNVRKAVQILKNSPSHQGSFIYVHHILGLKADYQSSYEFYVQPAQVSTGKGQYELLSNTKTAFTVQTLYFDSLTTSFVFGVK